MNLSRLILRNLWHFRRPYLAVFAGVFVSTAVLTGALIVGDSVRFSLTRMADQRLGKIRLAMVPGERLFRQELANDMAREGGLTVVPILQTGGIAISNERNTRINHVDITGIPEGFTLLWGDHLAFPAEDEAILSLNAAARLGVKPGEEILLRIQPLEKASRNAPFVPDSPDPVSLRLRVKTLAGDDAMGRFSLKNEQSAPFNVFVNIRRLASRLKLSGMANGLVVAGDGQDKVTPDHLDSLVKGSWQPADAGLLIRPLQQPGWYEISSDRIFISGEQAGVIRTVFPCKIPILTYMVNNISSGDRSTPYSFVTAADTGLLHQSIRKKEIIINSWLADDLEIGPGDLLKLTYWVMGPMRSLKEVSSRFIVKSVIPLDAVPSGQRLMPDFPGLSGAGNCRDWETGSPVKLDRIRDKDEAYWKSYRGTPKAFISLGTGMELWTNAFGSLTAIRFKANAKEIPFLTGELVKKLVPSQNGLRFRTVFAEGKAAAGHSTDFGELFLGLSFFIIAASLLLTALLFSMHISYRLPEAGILAAVGFRRPLIYRLLMGEAMMVALIGGMAGSLGGILCNALLLEGLNTLWYDAVQTSSLVPDIRISTLLMGALAGMVTAWMVMALTLRRKLKMPAAQLVKGAPMAPQKTGLRRPRNIVAVVLLALGTFTIIITGANRKTTSGDHERSSGTGGLLLWCETALPILQDLNSTIGKAFFSIEDESLFDSVTFIPLQRQEGDDASCLNLNRVSRPTLMAAPAALFDSLGAFSFASLDPSVDPRHPWLALEKCNDSGVINGIADMSVITWGLQRKIGDTLQYRDEQGRTVLIRLAGGLENSVFQGNLLISDTSFRALYPSVSGFKLMLIDGAAAKRDTLARKLEMLMRDYGMMTLPAGEKLVSFNAVENTYLMVFMMLGGLGMIIGTIGLGIILWRNIRERQRELALLQAIGYPKNRILRRLFNEYLRILLAGTGAGLITGLLAILPNLLSPGYHLPVLLIGAILLLILLSGLAWIWFPARAALKKDILPGLREE